MRRSRLLKKGITNDEAFYLVQLVYRSVAGGTLDGVED